MDFLHTLHLRVPTRPCPNLEEPKTVLDQFLGAPAGSEREHVLVRTKINTHACVAISYPLYRSPANPLHRLCFLGTRKKHIL
jgi:hypothetical protein